MLTSRSSHFWHVLQTSFDFRSSVNHSISATAVLPANVRQSGLVIRLLFGFEAPIYGSSRTSSSSTSGLYDLRFISNVIYSPCPCQVAPADHFLQQLLHTHLPQLERLLYSVRGLRSRLSFYIQYVSDLFQGGRVDTTDGFNNFYEQSVQGSCIFLRMFIKIRQFA